MTAQFAAKIIDGKAIAEGLRADIARAVSEIEQRHGFKPSLATVLVGEDPASQVYVRSKAKQTAEAGMASFEHRLPATASEAELLALVDRMNRDSAVDGVLVQLPLPAHIDPRKIFAAIDPVKDVDGFNPVNAGRLANADPALVPCTPSGCLILARHVRSDLAGLHAVVVGRSNIVGKPMAHLLLGQDCTVTIAHSRTRDLASIVASADLLVAAIGRPEFVKGSWIKPGAIVIDVGINRIDIGGGKSKLVGDVEFERAAERASAITPVPGGVGPMTIACLLQNTLTAACARRGLAVQNSTRR